MPKREVLHMCEETIKLHFGNLDDLPYELANTIANVYYRFFNLSIDTIKEAMGNPGWVSKQVKREADLANGLKSFMEDTARFTSDFKAALKFINALRQIDKHEEPNRYQFLVEFILDVLKYDLTDAHKKTGFRRMLERKFSKAKDREIPNLIGLLDL